MATDTTLLPLGQPTQYPNQYDPSQLVGVPRAQTRDFWPAHQALPFDGSDHWTGYELAWLNAKGKPETACLLLSYSATSPAIVESKSLKLYLNSLNQTVFTDTTELLSTLQHDISVVVGTAVHATLLPLDAAALAVAPWADHCLDTLDIDTTDYHCDAGLLGCHPDDITEETLITHAFRSVCPVTGQPDWASVRIHYTGPRLRHDSLLRYLCSYRLHGGFHEQCVERIFCDLHRQCLPQQLSVEGRFTRRGGLDINPFRCTAGSTVQPTLQRQVRQ